MLLHLLLKDPNAPEMRFRSVRLKRAGGRSSIRARYVISKIQ
jgi:hypothetical protein